MFPRLRSFSLCTTVFALAFSALAARNLSDEFTVDVSGRHTLYLYKSNSSCAIVDVASDQRPLYKKSALKGESVFVENAEDARRYAKDVGAIPVFSEKTDDAEIFCMYSPLIPYHVTVNGEKVNVHLAVKKDGGAVIGVPFIFGSY